MKHYDSNTEKEQPTTEWMQKVIADDLDYWNSQTRVIKGSQEIFKASLATGMQRFNHTGGVHTVQWMYGCELHEDGTKRGYMQDGYDGEDWLSLDLNTGTWTAANAKAVITKQSWEGLGDAARQKNFLENECITWLQKYVEYGRSTLERKSKVVCYCNCSGYTHTYTLQSSVVVGGRSQQYVEPCF